MPEQRDLGAHGHGLLVANACLFNISLPGLACVCDKSAEAGASCAWSFPFQSAGQRRAGVSGEEVGGELIGSSRWVDSIPPLSLFPLCLLQERAWLGAGQAAAMLPSFSYLTEHTGFRGTIKNSPRDFIVTELEVPELFLRDARAESLQKTSEAPPAQSSPCPREPKIRRTESPGPGALGCLQDAAPGPLGHGPSRMGGGCAASPGKTPVLESLLGKPVSELLNKFACDLKDAWGLENNADAGTREFSLGPRLDKKIRADLHSAVRQKFPFLVTVTKDNEMIVKGNPDYRELCQLVTEKETNDFFKFLDAKLENSTFSFEPDGNKEHRKIVHHFISRKFGKLLETKSFTVTDVNDQPNMSIMVRFREKSWSRKRSAGGFQNKQDVYTGKYYIFSEGGSFMVFCRKTETQDHFI